MKRKIAIIAIFILALLLSACAGEAYVEITTGGTGGSYFPVGEAIANAVDDNVESLTVKAEPGYGSIANCYALGSGDAQSALIESNIAMWAYRGEQMFDGKPIRNFKAVAALYPHPIQIVTITGRDIAEVSDLEGKTVCLGEQGSAMYADAVNVLDVYDIQLSDINPLFLPYTDGLQKLKKGELDAVFLTGSYPDSAIAEVTQTRTIVLVPISEFRLEELIVTSPGYMATEIPIETYPAMADDILAAGTMVLWVCAEDMSDEIVYRMTKAFWENIAYVKAGHEQAEHISQETAFDGLAIPIHPGAKRYYDEIENQ